MSDQICAIGKAIRPLFADRVTYSIPEQVELMYSVSNKQISIVEPKYSDQLKYSISFGGNLSVVVMEFKQVIKNNTRLLLHSLT